MTALGDFLHMAAEAEGRMQTLGWPREKMDDLADAFSARPLGEWWDVVRAYPPMDFDRIVEASTWHYLFYWACNRSDALMDGTTILHEEETQ